MALLSMDVGKSIYCIAELRDYLSWGQYYADIDPQATALFDDFKSAFFQCGKSVPVGRNLYQSASKYYERFPISGEVELENSAFELSLFQELDSDDADLEKDADGLL